VSGTELENVTPGSSQTMMDLLGWNLLPLPWKSMRLEGFGYQMLPSWNKGKL
jgi:hypothetical protein